MPCQLFPVGGAETELSGARASTGALGTSREHTGGMQTSEFLITADLALAARALAQVSGAYVADRAGLDPGRLRAFERGNADLVVGEKLRLQRALEDCGVLFVPEDAQFGYGVRHRLTRAKMNRLENWENEGGPASEHDV